MTHSAQLVRFIVLLGALANALPLSLSAETRRTERTDIEQLAAELRQVLGPENVDVSRSSHPPEQAEAPSPQRTEPLVVLRGGISVEDVVAEMNRHRVAYGLAPLRLDERLTLAAHDRVSDMATKRYFGHVAPDGTQPWFWVTERGYRYASVGENLAAGYGSARHVVDGWMRSRGHRANILGKFSDVGVAVANVRTGVAGPTFVALYASSR